MRLLKLFLLSALWFALAAYAVEPVKDNTYTESNSAFAISADQPEFMIKLKSNPTTGYSWFLREYNTALIESVSHAFQAPTDKKLMGASGFEVWKFKVKPAAFTVPQQTTLKFVYARPWESGEPTTQQLFKVTTLAK